MSRAGSARRPALPRHARRWDAVVLGSALPGLVAAARLAVQGQRVLIVEEAAAAGTAPVVREPFFLSGARGGVLEACLRELNLPLIERRALEPRSVAFQMILPDARLDLGEPQRYADELVAWGLAKPEPARALLRAIAHAAEAEGAALLAAPVVRSGGLRGLSRAGARPSIHGRGLPVEVSEAEGLLAAVLDAQVRALSNLAASSPPPEARARLLGAALSGGAAFPASDLGVRELLLRRIRSRHGEVRTIGAPFSFAAAGQDPALAVDGVGELWAGRVLVVNAPACALARRLRAWQRPVPAFLDAAPAATHHRVSIHFECRPDAIPDGMDRSLVCVADPTRPPVGTGLVTLARHPRPERDDEEALEDVVASAVVATDASLDATRDAIEATVRDLMPFCGERLVRRETPRPGWDDDSLLADPARGEGWPGEVDTRATHKPPVHRLPREALACLGLEGDLLLGWRAGDALAAELS